MIVWVKQLSFEDSLFQESGPRNGVLENQNTHIKADREGKDERATEKSMVMRMRVKMKMMMRILKMKRKTKMRPRMH